MDRLEAAVGFDVLPLVVPGKEHRPGGHRRQRGVPRRGGLNVDGAEVQQQGFGLKPEVVAFREPVLIEPADHVGHVGGDIFGLEVPLLDQRRDGAVFVAGGEAHAGPDRHDGGRPADARPRDGPTADREHRRRSVYLTCSEHERGVVSGCRGDAGLVVSEGLSAFEEEAEGSCEAV